MIRITDENPYEVLGLPQNADKKAIDKAFARKNRGNHKHQARKAYDALRKPEERILVDVITPAFIDVEVDQGALIALCAESLDWDRFIDEPLIYQQDYQSLTEAIIRHFFTQFSPPTQQVELGTAFDGLEEFKSQWCK